MDFYYFLAYSEHKAKRSEFIENFVISKSVYEL